MNQSGSKQTGANVSSVEKKDVKEPLTSEAVSEDMPKITFRGNTYDLASLGSLITGGLVLFSCLTCNMGYYCLPIIAIALGAIGILRAQQAADSERTRLWSWLGIAGGGIVFLLTVAAILLYIGFIVMMIATDELG